MTKSLSVVQVSTSPGLVASSVTAPVSRSIRYMSKAWRSRRLSATRTKRGCCRSVKTFCARTPRNGVRSRTLPYSLGQPKKDARFRRRRCPADKRMCFASPPQAYSGDRPMRFVRDRVRFVPSIALAHTLSTSFLSGASQAICAPSGETSGCERSGLPKRISRGMSAGNLA